MTEWIISSSVLILLVLAVRALLKGKISLRLQYALWALVLVRLLVPVNLFSSPFSVLTLTQQLTGPQVSVSVPEIIPGETAPHIESTVPVTSPTPAVPGTSPVPQPTPEPRWEYPFTTGQTLGFLWVLGMAVMAGIMAVNDLRFARQLKKNRISASMEQELPVYVCDTLDSPCLFGLFRPSIYLPVSCQDSPGVISHVLAHELAHYRHLDHIWSVLRCLCLCLHWYNPLVWVAALLSRRDSELACDEAAIQALGEAQRTGYGKTLIGLSCAKSKLLNTATTLDGSKRTLKERIRLIAKNPKTTFIPLICVILAAVAAIVLTFTGVQQLGGTDQIQEPPVYNDSGIEGCFLYTGHTLYVWDYTAEAPVPRDGVAQESGTVTSNDNGSIPCEPGAACRLEVGTVIYADTVYDYLYTKPGPIGSGLEYATFVPVMDTEQWWQQSTIQPGYYAYYANKQMNKTAKDALYIYLDGTGEGTYISGGMETTLTVSGQVLQISRNYSIQYRIDGSILSTPQGAYIYIGTEKPELPVCSPLTVGTYTINAELGAANNYYSLNINEMILHQDGNGSLTWEDKTYFVSWSEQGLYVDNQMVSYYFDAEKNKGCIAMQVNGNKMILTFYNNITVAPLRNTNTSIETLTCLRPPYVKVCDISERQTGI